MPFVQALRRTLALAGSTAALATPALAQSGGLTVDGKTNIYAAGGNSPTEPGGSLGAFVTPTAIALTAGTGRVLTVAAAGTWNCFGGGPVSGPDGDGCAGSLTNINAAGAISGIQTATQTMFLVGLFLGPSLPGAAPARLSYSAADLTSAAYAPPALGQVFYIGDGLTGTGVGASQAFGVPDGATRLYFGVADAFGFSGDPGAYGDNNGALDVSYDIVGTSTVPEPTSLALAASGVAALLGWGARRRRA